MYIGSNIICNESIILHTGTDGVTIRIPSDYPFPTDPMELNNLKYIPFYFTNDRDISALTISPFQLMPFEAVQILCQIDQDKREGGN